MGENHCRFVGTSRWNFSNLEWNSWNLIAEMEFLGQNFASVFNARWSHIFIKHHSSLKASFMNVPFKNNKFLPESRAHLVSIPYQSAFVRFHRIVFVAVQLKNSFASISIWIWLRKYYNSFIVSLNWFTFRH